MVRALLFRGIIFSSGELSLLMAEHFSSGELSHSSFTYAYNIYSNEHVSVLALGIFCCWLDDFILPSPFISPLRFGQFVSFTVLFV